MLRFSSFLIVLTIIFSCNKESLSPESSILYNADYALNEVIYKDGYLIFAGGDTWTTGQILKYELSSGSIEELNLHQSILLDILAGDNNCYTIGIDNNLFKSIDGTMWTKVPLDSNFVARDLLMSETHLISVGGLANFKGQLQLINLINLELEKSIGFDHQLNSISRLSEDSMIAAGFGAIYISNNQGLDWHVVDYAGDDFQDIIYHDGQVFVLGQGGLIFESNDGIRFEEIRSYQISNPGFRRIIIRDNGDMLIIGDDGKMEKNNGEEWIKFDTGHQTDFQCIIEAEGSIYVGTKQGEIIEIEI